MKFESNDTPPHDPIAAHLEVDACGLRCPLPILRAKKGLASLESGQILRVFTTDQSAREDFQAFCKQTGNALLTQKESESGILAHTIRRR
jgi:tRNA 2-thiouridine synthesizing protein A